VRVTVGVDSSMVSGRADDTSQVDLPAAWHYNFAMPKNNPAPMPKRPPVSLFTVPLFLILIALAWTLIVPAPMPEALQALQSDSSVAVSTEGWLVFQPVGDTPEAGLVIYPGARVKAQSYAPVARALAEQGTLAVIVPMPLNLAILGSGRAVQAIEAFPQVTRWAVGGHSLGGAMAASVARKRPDLIDGLVLWAAYPGSADNLSSSTMPIVSIYGTRDGLTTPDKIEASRSLLPASARFVAIAGGNHAQFGWYGSQWGDGPADIGREEQMRQVVASTLELLQELP